MQQYDQYPLYSGMNTGSYSNSPPGMNNSVPMPNMGVPTDMTPPQYPVQNYQPMAAMSNRNQAQAQYAYGGSVNTPHSESISYYDGGSVSTPSNAMYHPSYAGNGMADMAEHLRNQAYGDDTILAHINPQEAHQLEMQSGGGGMNPHTGLPQYGKFGKILKAVAGIAAPVVGTMVGGPMGGAIGGALGAKLNKQNPILGALGSYALGGGFGELGGLGGVLPGIGNAAGMQGLTGVFPGMQHAGVMGNLFGGAGAANAMGTGADAGGMGGLNGLQTALLGLTGYGLLKGKKTTANEPTIQQHIAANVPPSLIPKDEPYRKVKPMERTKRQISEEEYMRPGAPQQSYYEDEYQEPQFMANGGYLDGHTGGQADDIDAKLSDGEFVIPADVVSSLGDGNNKHGAGKLYDFMSHVRTHKTSKGGKGLPPKAKSLQSYMTKRN